MFPDITHPPARTRQALAESLTAYGLSAALVSEFAGISRPAALALQAVIPLEHEKRGHARSATNDPSLLSLAHSMYALQSMMREFERQPEASTIECIIAALHAYEARSVETHQDKYYRATLHRFIKIYKTAREKPEAVGHCANCGCAFIRVGDMHESHCPLCRATKVKICSSCSSPYVLFSLQPYRGEGSRPNRCGHCIA